MGAAIETGWWPITIWFANAAVALRQLVVAEQANLRVRLYGLGDLLKLVVLPGIVGIQESHVGSLSGLDSHVSRSADHSVVLVVDYFDSLVLYLIDDIKSIVRGVVVYNYHIKVSKGLIQHRL